MCMLRKLSASSCSLLVLQCRPLMQEAASSKTVKRHTAVEYESANEEGFCRCGLVGKKGILLEEANQGRTVSLRKNVSVSIWQGYPAFCAIVLEDITVPGNVQHLFPNYENTCTNLQVLHTLLYYGVHSCIQFCVIFGTGLI